MGLERSLRRWIGPDVAGPWLQLAGAKPSQGAPAQLTTNMASEVPAEPSSHGPSAPAVALGVRAGNGLSQLREL